LNLLVFNIRVDADHPTQATATRWLSALAPHFQKVIVITLHKGRLYVPGNILVHAVTKTGRESKICKVINFYRILLGVLRNDRIDACFVYQAVALGAMAGAVLNLMKIPTVMWYAHSKISLMLKICHHFADRAISTSRETFPLKSDRLVVTGQGIDTSFFSPFTKNPNERQHRGFLIVSISRFAPIKKIEVLFDALQFLVRDGRSRFSVHLYGLTQTAKEERYLEDLKLKVVQLGLAKYVVWKGKCSNWDVPSILKNADLFASQQEKGGVDRAVLEAMSCGIPVLLSNASFESIISEDYMEKLFFAPGCAEDMASKLRYLMRCPHKERKRLGSILRGAVVRGHSIDALAEKIKCIMDELVGRIAA